MIAHPSTIVCQWPLGCLRMAAGYDHDHITGMVRAALCSHHNAMLRSGGDQPATLRELADWLEHANLGFTYSDYRTERHQLNGQAYYSLHKERIKIRTRDHSREVRHVRKSS